MQSIGRFEVQSNPFITTVVYSTPRLERHIFCGNNSSSLTARTHSTDVTTFVYNDTKYSLGFSDRASWAKYEDRKPNKMQQLDVYY